MAERFYPRHGEAIIPRDMRHLFPDEVRLAEQRGIDLDFYTGESGQEELIDTIIIGVTDYQRLQNPRWRRVLVRADVLLDKAGDQLSRRTRNRLSFTISRSFRPPRGFVSMANLLRLHSFGGRCFMEVLLAHCKLYGSDDQYARDVRAGRYAPLRLKSRRKVARRKTYLRVFLLLESALSRSGQPGVGYYLPAEKCIRLLPQRTPVGASLISRLRNLRAFRAMLRSYSPTLPEEVSGVVRFLFPRKDMAYLTLLRLRYGLDGRKPSTIEKTALAAGVTVRYADRICRKIATDLRIKGVFFTAFFRIEDAMFRHGTLDAQHAAKLLGLPHVRAVRGAVQLFNDISGSDIYRMSKNGGHIHSVS